MNFEKKIIRIKKTKSTIPNILGIFGVFIIFLVGIFLIGYISKIDCDFFDKIVLTSEENKQKQLNKEKINILILGRGGGKHDAPNLTDTIILASINTKKENISLLSIPRDLYVEYPNGKTGKINEIYRVFTKIYGSKKAGIKSIENKISEITGEKIDYYVNIDFEGFTKIIDVFEGIEIKIEKNFVDEKFPDNSLEYTTFVLRKGTRTIDGETALKYVRSRHSTSDFDRSIRQHQVLKALKDKVISQGLFSSSKKIKELYSIFKHYIDTDIDLKTLLKLSKLLKDTDKINLLSFNLNDSCFYGTTSCTKGGILYVPLRKYFSGSSVLLPNGADKTNLNDYDEIQKYTNLIFNKPEIFKKENYEINVFNSLKVNFLASEIGDKIKKYGYNIPEKNSIGNTDKIYEKSVVYYNNIEENSKTLESLKTFLNAKFQKVENPVYSKQENVKIEIIIGEDYKQSIKF